jgi:uncharacterized protein (DUF1330 family)
MTEQAIVMLNALWFKAEGGKELYAQYLEAATPFIEAVGGRKLPSYMPDRSVIGEFDADLVFFVEYPSWDAFKTFLWNEEYRERAVPLREAAIEKSLLIRCQPSD